MCTYTFAIVCISLHVVAHDNAYFMTMSFWCTNIVWECHRGRPVSFCFPAKAVTAGVVVPGHLFGCYLASTPAKVRWRLASAGLAGEGPRICKDMLVSRQADWHSRKCWQGVENNEELHTPDNVVSTACVLELQFRTLPWHPLTADGLPIHVLGACDRHHGLAAVVFSCSSSRASTLYGQSRGLGSRTLPSLLLSTLRRDSLRICGAA